MVKLRRETCTNTNRTSRGIKVKYKRKIVIHILRQFEYAFCTRYLHWKKKRNRKPTMNLQRRPDKFVNSTGGKDIFPIKFVYIQTKDIKIT